MLTPTLSTVFLSASCIFFLSFPFFPLLLLFLSTRKYGRATRAPSPELEDVPPRPLEVREERVGEGHSLTRKSPQLSLRREHSLFPKARHALDALIFALFRSQSRECDTLSSFALRTDARQKALGTKRRRFVPFAQPSFSSSFRRSRPLSRLVSLPLASPKKNNPQDYVRARLVQFAGAFASSGVPAARAGRRPGRCCGGDCPPPSSTARATGGARRGAARANGRRPEGAAAGVPARLPVRVSGLNRRAREEREEIRERERRREGRRAHVSERGESSETDSIPPLSPPLFTLPTHPLIHKPSNKLKQLPRLPRPALRALRAQPAPPLLRQLRPQVPGQRRPSRQVRRADPRRGRRPRDGLAGAAAGPGAACRSRCCVLDGNAYDARCVEAGAEREGDLDACALLLNNRGAPLLAFGGGAAAATRRSTSERATQPPRRRRAFFNAVAPRLRGRRRSLARPRRPRAAPPGEGLAGGAVPLPDLHVTDSSEAMLSGRKPPSGCWSAPWSGLARQGGPEQRRRRRSAAGKEATSREARRLGGLRRRDAQDSHGRQGGDPNVDDHVSKLEHMGKETVKKLQVRRGRERREEEREEKERERERRERELIEKRKKLKFPPSKKKNQKLQKKNSKKGHRRLGPRLRRRPGGPHQRPLPDNCVESVGAFRRLALLAEGDGHLRQKLQAVLKLSKEKWDDARDHALRAVVADSRMRIWYSPDAAAAAAARQRAGNNEHAGGGGGGRPALCGSARRRRPRPARRRPAQEAGRPRSPSASAAEDAAALEATLAAQQTPAQREAVRALRPRAAAAWW